MDIYKIINPKTKKTPIIISVPHSGSYIPDSIKNKMNPEVISKLDDTDWFVDKLYDFASDMGITIIIANYSRWVVDLNRNPVNKALYNDGRVITDVVTSTDFNGNLIYKENQKPDENEIRERIEKFHLPYQIKLEELITQMKKEFGKVLLFDAHSIRKNVPGIRKEDFPDFILGDNDETSSSPIYIKTVLESLQNKGYVISHNHPFKGGFITRHFGNPKENIHALQLEMCKTNYMDADELNYNEANASKIRDILQPMFNNLIEKLNLENPQS